MRNKVTIFQREAMKKQHRIYDNDQKEGGGGEGQGGWVGGGRGGH